jgi:glutathione synthase
MPVRLGVVMDPIHTLNFKKDSTLAMLWAAQDRGWEIQYMEPGDLYLRDGEARAHMRPLDPLREAACWWRLGDGEDAPLASLTAILMRKDPPFDMEFVYLTHMLSLAESAGSLVVNRASSLRDHNEKLFIARFPQCCVPTLVSADKTRLRRFAAEQGDIVMKPLHGMGGTAIFRTRADDVNLSTICEVLTGNGRTPVMAQRFIPEISAGDKRILMIDGQPVDHCLARIPAAGEARGNLAAGGRGVVQPLSDRDRWICDQVGPVLREQGLLFVGLDVIGDYLTEINVTSPTCIREIEAATGQDIAGRLMDVIARQTGVQAQLPGSD